MARLSKSRKREIRLAVRSIVACEVRNMDRKNFDNIGESEEENLYIADFVGGLADSIDLRPAEGAADE